MLSTLTCRQSHTVSAEGCQPLTRQREHDPKRKTREHDSKRKARERDPTRKAQELDPKRKTREHNNNGSPLVVRVDLNNMVQSTNASMPEAGDVGIVYRLPIPVRECPFRPPGMPAMCLPFPRDTHNAPTTPFRFLASRRSVEAPGSPNVATPPE